MHLPSSLQQSLESLISSSEVHSLTKGREELTERYRHPSRGHCMTTEAQRFSYLISRFPATYAAIYKSLQAVKERAPFPIKSLLDLGAGPGTAMWVVSELFPELEKVTLIERDSSLISIGKQLTQSSSHPSLQEAHWIEEELERVKIDLSHDLVLLSYVVGELPSHALIPLLKKAWDKTSQLLLIVEPGTPEGFERIHLIRRHLFEWGGDVVAPCPHHLSCPMSGGDWCHFAARVERTSLHRKIKGGTLGYEDEKFSYIAVSKSAVSLPKGRILAPPNRHSGHMTLKLCTPNGLEHPTISKKQGDLYKIARKAEWGDSIIH